MNGDANGITDDPLDASVPSLTNIVEEKKTLLDSGQESTEIKTSNNGDYKPEPNKGNEETGVKINATHVPVPSEDSEKNLQSESSNKPESVEILQDKSEPNNKKLEPTEGKIKFVEIDDDSQASIMDSIDTEDDPTDDDDDDDMFDQDPFDTVSINSDSDYDDGNHQNSIIFVDSQTLDKPNRLKKCGSPSEIHEIDSEDDNEDDCVVTSEVLPDKVKSKSKLNNGSAAMLRRSIRKRKSYPVKDDDDDVQLVGVDNSKVKNKKTSFMNRIESFIQHASKRKRANDKENRQKSVVEKKDTKHAKKSVESSNAKELCESITARGTTVTPLSHTTATETAAATVVTTSSASTQCSPPPPLLLPSLTDDMFVVEAPSFVVPYVYEKPSLKAFREFVDNLGKQLEELRLKEEKEKQEKPLKEKDKQEQEKEKEGEEGVDKVEKDSQQTGDASVEEDKNKKARKRRKKEDDDASWDGSEDESSAESEDDIVSDEDKRVVIKEVDDFEVIKDVLASTNKIVQPAKTDAYFDCSLGKFFMEIGLNQVQEYVQNDLLKLQNRKLVKEKKSGRRTRDTEVAIASLKKNIELSSNNNAQYTYAQKKCEFCSFQTESLLVMSNHFETPHMKNGLYKCNFCPLEIRTPQEIIGHMENIHKVRGKLEKAPGNHLCSICPFEDNSKGRLARHLISCAKKFKPEVNLSPPTEWEPPAKIPKISKSRNSNAMSGFTTSSKGPQINNYMGRPSMMLGSAATGSLNAFRPGAQFPAPSMPRTAPAQHERPNIVVRHYASPPASEQSNQTRNSSVQKPSSQQPSISIRPLSRSPQLTRPPLPQVKGTFVICEICDGYIKDLEQLRNHMQWIHKVKIHPKMIYNRPPLNCQKCQFRFFTDQGLERHLLGTHGLVTSAMQEAANKGKDAGRCPVCGRVYQWKLLHHVAKDHLLTLKPAHLSYKCTVCTATFGMYKLFESHVYSAHRVAAKRVADSGKPTAPGMPQGSDGATVADQPAAIATSGSK